MKRQQQRPVETDVATEGARWDLPVVLLVLSAMAFATSLLTPAPSQAGLQHVEGVIADLDFNFIGSVRSRVLESVELRLEGDSRHFRYEAESGQAKGVAAALRGAKGRHVEIWIDAASPRVEWDTKEEFLPIYALEIEGRTLRTRDQVAQSRQSQHAFGQIAGVALFVVGLFAAVLSWRASRKRKENS
jgi:hypothetical protein